MTDDDYGFGLLFPFVVCVTNGGKFEDDAFVAGARFGAISQQCQDRVPVIESYVDTYSVQQYDLLAMHHGYTMTAEPWEDYPDDWTWISMTAPTFSADDQDGTTP